MQVQAASQAANPAGGDWPSQMDVSAWAATPEWRALIHAPDGQPRVNDPAFLLSAPAFSAERELAITLDRLFRGQRGAADELDAICRFPARFEWLRVRSGLTPAHGGSLDQCPALAEFLEKAPAHRVSLVYASENLVSPSSMMGHVFLKLGGVRADGSEVDYAISFFTIIEGLSLPQAIFKTLITGQRGYYTLSPYAVRERHYLEVERRSVWEYELSFSDAEKRHLALHLHELRPIPMMYFFDSHNCATLTADLLAVVRPRIALNTSPWMSPLDVVRHAHREQAVSASTLIPSAGWKVRMYEDQVGRKEARAIAVAVQHAATLETPTLVSTGQTALQWLLAEAVAEQLALDDSAHAARYEAVAASARQGLHDSHGDINIDISTYKRAERSPADSQWHVGYRRAPLTDDGLILRLLPAGRLLEDDSRNSFGRSELRIADTEVLIPTTGGAPRLEALTVYGITALMPLTVLGDGLSGRMSIGYRRQRDAHLEERGVFEISGALGHALEPLRGVVPFAMVGGALGFDWHRGYIAPELRLGVLVDRFAGLRTRLEWIGQLDPAGQGDQIGSIALTTIVPVAASGAWFVSMTHLVAPHEQGSELNVGYRHLF